MENPNNYYHLPEDILIEILSRVPAKSVGRFRCLSKSWRRDLSTTQFVKSHLNHKTNKTDSILLLGFNPRTIETISTPLEDNDTVVPRNLDFPDELVSKPEVVGSCNGLVLLVGHKQQDILVVINPLTLQHGSFKNTPLLSVDSAFGEVQYGFGYDGCSDDYKIVKITTGYIDGEKAGPFVDVYSMKKGLWKRLKNEPFNTSAIVAYYDHGIFLNGIIHWLAYVKDDVQDDRFVIAAFDVATESFHAIPVPKIVKEYCYRLLGISGCLFQTSASFGVWIMKEYGQVDSWTECSTIYNVSAQLPSGTKFLCVIGEDKILLSSFHSKNLFVRKLTELTIKAVNVDGTPNNFWAGCAFVDSLVSPIQYDVAS